jgi:glycosyltransferase involved in cell wall biosynthesis
MLFKMLGKDTLGKKTLDLLSMNILQVFNRYLEKGGEEAAVEKMSQILSTKHLITNCYYDSQKWKNDKSIFKFFKQAAAMFYNGEAVREFNHFIKTASPDLIILHNVFPVASLGVLLAATRQPIPVFCVLHNFRPFSVNGYLWANGNLQPQGLKLNFLPEILHASWQGSRIKTLLLALVIWTTHLLGVYKKISGWLAISDFMRMTFVQAGFANNKVHLLRHSWDARPTPAAASDITASPYLLFIGRLTDSKGVDVLLNAWLQVTKKVPDARLLIAGSGPMADELIERCVDLPRCEYLGHVGGALKEALFTQTTAVVVPSVWWEPLGLVVYEAYDFAKPVIASKSGGLTETVIHGVTGWLHEAGNTEELAQQMEEALLAPEQCRKRGAEGRKWLLNNTKVSDWLEKFEEIVGPTIQPLQN